MNVSIKRNYKYRKYDYNYLEFSFTLTKISSETKMCVVNGSFDNTVYNSRYM